MMKFPFTKCTTSQVDVLAEVSQRTFRDAFEAQNDPNDFADYVQKAFSRQQLLKELENPDMEFYLLYSGTDLAAYFKLNSNGAQTDLREDLGMELERIYVLEGFQGKGVGALILEYCKEIAKDRDKGYLWLGVWEKNHKAIEFYGRHGFNKFATHPYFIGRDEQTDWLMKWIPT
tara:strand:- start:113664 stop:114185 length:522 start_codon:yes stop_codon:yes gene_type:complete